MKFRLCAPNGSELSEDQTEHHTIRLNIPYRRWCRGRQGGRKGKWGGRREKKWEGKKKGRGEKREREKGEKGREKGEKGEGKGRKGHP